VQSHGATAAAAWLNARIWRSRLESVFAPI
jgi:hypothetical protein